MNRKDFLKKISLSAVIFPQAISCFYEPESGLMNSGPIPTGQPAGVSEQLKQQFQTLITWMVDNGWARFFRDETGLDLSLTGEALDAELQRPLDQEKLNILKTKQGGFDDFVGNQAIARGKPSSSLLYHALASPRVRPFNNATQYPSLTEIDILENYIYALLPWDEYGVKAGDNLYLAVFAYEYRPALKTPHRRHADLVFSRTGIARIGDCHLNYDPVNRCFTNNPTASEDPTGKRIAVTPARYGLFLATAVTNKEVYILATGRYKGTERSIDKADDRHDGDLLFLKPVRKVFNNDSLFNNSPIVFTENHESDKLAILTKNHSLTRSSATLIEDNVALTQKGSSYLVVPRLMNESGRNVFIKPATDAGKLVAFPVDSKMPRYFTSLYNEENEKKVEDIEILSSHKRQLYRIPNTYPYGRNGPMYVHLAHRLTEDQTITSVPKEANTNFETRLQTESCNVPLYEDGICDGCVQVDFSKLQLPQLQPRINPGILSAFSIVTAPDFFPYVDSLDLVDYDVSPGANKESNFYEGGVSSLAMERVRPNPRLTLPGSAGRAFPLPADQRDLSLLKTYTAVVSGETGSATPAATGNNIQERDYQSTSYLPDACSSVFAPGWDITYCDKVDGEVVPMYLSTQGLGAPFVEDMKLCAAMNGMWVAESPDTARNIQGSVTIKDSDQQNSYRNPTAIPLLDNELGIVQTNTTGWDGEQGPFLEKDGNSRWCVNFTDLGRADYVQNALDGRFDMSKLRNLNTRQLITRMECLKKCIKAIGHNRDVVGQTVLWLVSAEQLDTGTSSPHFSAIGIPADLAANGDHSWAQVPQFNTDKGDYSYLFVLANTKVDKDRDKITWAESGVNVKRRRLVCKQIYVCQVSITELRWLKIRKRSSITANSWRNA